jgi:hypothetical protein
MHPFRRNSPIPLARARAAHDRARAQLLAAEEAHAGALLALRRAEGAGGAEPPPYERHFHCGHAGMEHTTEGGDQVLRLCPTCRARQAASAAPFTERRLLLLREPRPDDPD